MSDKESLADCFIQWQRRVFIHNDTFEVLVNEVRALEQELDQCLTVHAELSNQHSKLETKYAEQIDWDKKFIMLPNTEIEELEAELNRCLTAHAELNDKACALKQAIQNTLDTGMDRYIREVIGK